MASARTGSQHATARGVSAHGKAARIHPVSTAVRKRGYSHYQRAIGSFHRGIHTRTYYRSHYERVVVVNGGGYYLDGGYWFPAYGYAPDAVFAFDGPIACYNDLPPDQVVTNVQTELQAGGYYTADPDGELNDDTRSSIAGFQQDAGLEVTYTVDEPTLTALGLI